MDPCLPDVPVELDIVPGHPGTALLSSAAQARLVVVGSCCRSAPVRALFGSTSREVLRRCPTPVAVLADGVSVDPFTAPDEPNQARSTGTGVEHPHDLRRREGRGRSLGGRLHRKGSHPHGYGTSLCSPPYWE